jgi:hypothetical protein
VSDLRTTYERARGEVAAMFNYNLAELTPEQALRVDTATALRLALDDLQGRIVRGESVDIAKMLTASEALAKLLPATVLAAPPPTPCRDPVDVMLQELAEMKRRGEMARLVNPDAGSPEIEHLREQVAALEAENARLRGVPEPAVTPTEVVPPSEWRGIEPIRGTDVPEPPIIDGAVTKRTVSDAPGFVDEPWRAFTHIDWQS